MRTQTSALRSKDLLGIETLTSEEITLILDTAEGFKEVSERPVKKVPALRGQLVINLFMEASTRTRVSFEIAEKRLSADTLNFGAAGSSVEKGETLIDTAENLMAMAPDMIVIRHKHPGAPKMLAERLPASIINAGDGAHEHPTQALLDSFPSLREYYNTFGLTPDRLRRAKEGVIVMHPGPMNRGVEIASDVADGPWSVILDQVTNGVAVRMAVLYLLGGAHGEP